MQGYVRRCGHMARMFSIGRSKEGRSLLALELSNNVGAVEAKPNARFVGNMHGDEPASRCRWAAVFMLYAQRDDCAGLCFRLVGSTWPALLDSDLQAQVTHGTSYTLWGSVQLWLLYASVTHLFTELLCWAALNALNALLQLIRMQSNAKLLN